MLEVVMVTAYTGHHQTLRGLTVMSKHAHQTEDHNTADASNHEGTAGWLVVRLTPPFSKK